MQMDGTLYIYVERDLAYTLSTAVMRAEHKNASKNPSRHAVRRDTSTRAQFRQYRDTQKTLVHGPGRRPDHDISLRERVRVDRDPIYGHFGDGPVLLAHGQLLQSV